jgi:hypothetical protein
MIISYIAAVQQSCSPTAQEQNRSLQIYNVLKMKDLKGFVSFLGHNYCT